MIGEGHKTSQTVRSTDTGRDSRDPLQGVLPVHDFFYIFFVQVEKNGVSISCNLRQVLERMNVYLMI